eukprot:gene1394-biopygen1493
MFVRYVSHEIRTPLNAVVLGLHYLKKQSELEDNVMDKDVIDVVEEVRMSCDAAIDILNDLLTYEKLDGGLLQTYFKPEPAFDFVLEVTKAFRLQANQSRLFKEVVQISPDVLQNGNGSGFGLWIEEAEDGLVALSKVNRMMEGGECPYDVILMDFMMPTMDGPTATRAIRGLGYKGIIIGVTGNSSPQDILLFTSIGADLVLPKPLDVDLLTSTIQRMLQARTAD